MIMDINEAWNELRRRVSECRRCALCETRHNTVVGEGPVNCKCVIVGEAPGEEEDLSGRPFVGPAGRLLTDILEKGGSIPRDSVYITNVVKCRPPNNKDPDQKYIDACSEFLEAQLLLLHPEIIVTLGNVPTKALLNTTDGITKLRGEFKPFRGVRIYPMFHPSFLLRNQGDTSTTGPKYLTWRDVQKLKTALDEL